LLLGILGPASLAALADDAASPAFEWQLDWYEMRFANTAELTERIPEFRKCLGTGEPSHVLQMCWHWWDRAVFEGVDDNIGFRATYRIYLSYPQTVSVTIRADDAFRFRMTPRDPTDTAAPEADDADGSWDLTRWYEPIPEHVDEVFQFAKELEAGWHLIELQYAEAGGEAYIEFDIHIPEYEPISVWEHAQGIQETTEELEQTGAGLAAEVRALESRVALLEATIAGLQAELMRLYEEEHSWQLTEHQPG